MKRILVYFNSIVYELNFVFDNLCAEVIKKKKKNMKILQIHYHIDY